ncbi:MAG: tRNA pseudouridine(38-40) synthase TruA [Spirochaetes bacterium]|jgi:tRNA pseudouridine38-40 synthase|nr:tRNA pseudouridine(38-40) synthase TruA [Spirochaetota bacterium]
MRNVRLTLSYDGSNFNGWQIQARGRTVQGVLESALAEIHGERVPVVAAGRTDSGVHALAQVVNFKTAHPSIPTGKFREALNSLLPLDVRVHESREVPEGFHARYSARLREYRYYLLATHAAPGHQHPYCHRVKGPLEVRLLNRMSAALLGEQDFATFAAGGAAADENTVRVVHAASFYPAGPFICFRVVANGFLWKMVRSIVGTLLATADADCPGGADPVRVFHDAVAARDRSRAGTTAPARGLFLQRVTYDQ